MFCIKKIVLSELRYWIEIMIFLNVFLVKYDNLVFVSWNIDKKILRVCFDKNMLIVN